MEMKILRDLNERIGLQDDFWWKILMLKVFVFSFVPEKPFSGADDEQGRRDGPVQFEKKDSYEDVFQLDKFMELAKRVRNI